jgi:hypothetical protein
MRLDVASVATSQAHQPPLSVCVCSQSFTKDLFRNEVTPNNGCLWFWSICAFSITDVTTSSPRKLMPIKMPAADTTERVLEVRTNSQLANFS